MISKFYPRVFSMAALCMVVVCLPAHAQTTSGKDTIVIFGSHFAPGAQAKIDGNAVATIRLNSRTLKAVVPAGYTPNTYKVSVVNPGPQRGGAASEKDLKIISESFIALEYHYITTDMSFQQPQNSAALSGADSLWVLARSAPVSKKQKYDGFVFIDGTSTVTIEEQEDPTLSYIADVDVPSVDDISATKIVEITSRFVANQAMLPTTMRTTNIDGSTEIQDLTITSYKTLVDSLKTSPILSGMLTISQQMQALLDNAQQQGLSTQSLGSGRWRIDVSPGKFPTDIPDIQIPSGMSASLIVNVSNNNNFMEAVELQQGGQPISRTFYRKAQQGNNALFQYDAIYTETFYTTPDNLAMKTINSVQYSDSNFIVKVKPTPPVR